MYIDKKCIRISSIRCTAISLSSFRINRPVHSQCVSLRMSCLHIALVPLDLSQLSEMSTNMCGSDVFTQTARQRAVLREGIGL